MKGLYLFLVNEFTFLLLAVHVAKCVNDETAIRVFADDQKCRLEIQVISVINGIKVRNVFRKPQSCVLRK